MRKRHIKVHDVTIGWISALPLELEAAKLMLDEEYENDGNTLQYVLGRIGRHNIVLGCLPKGQMGNNPAAVVATKMQAEFPALQFGLMIGIGGGVPTLENDIRLGDVVIGSPSGSFGGVVQYDFGKIGPGGVQTRTGFLNAPPTTLLTALALLEADRNASQRITTRLRSSNTPARFTRQNAGPDRLYHSSCNHEGGSTCDTCPKDMLIQRDRRENEEILIHYGTIASGSEVMKDAITRDKLSEQLGGVLCFEMEAAGLMNSFPCLVVRGICDYADSHKNKSWQPLAAMTAAICTKEILSLVPEFRTLSTPSLQAGLPPSPVDATGEDKVRSQILHAWRLTDPRDDRKQIENDKNPLLDGSCSWIFTDPAFVRWWDENDCRILSIHGDPGKGKTMMTMAIIDEISQRLESCTDSAMLAYFFCQSRSVESNNASAIIRGLTFLLSAQKDCLVKHLQRKYQEAGSRLFEGPSSLYSIWSTLLELFQDTTIQRYYIVVDALDECDHDSMEKFLQLLSQEIPRSHKVKWIVTTRNEQRIMEHLQCIENGSDIDLELNSVDINHAVQSFIDLRVDILKRRKRYDEELSMDIKSHLKENADGTFLWVSLVCKELEKCFARKAREVCRRFPTGLIPLYQEMLTRIEQSDDSEELIQLLQTLAVTCRSLHLSELGMIADLPELSYESQDWQNARDLVASCGSFLMVRQQVVEFVHKSAKDYFIDGAGSRIFPTGQSCIHNALSSRLIVLMCELLRRDLCDLGDESMTAEQIDQETLYGCLPLHLRYACSFWEEHVRKGQSSLEDNDHVHTFLQKDFLYWLEALSLTGRVKDAILILMDLQKLLKGMVEDSWRFVRSFRSTIEEAPLQIYCSALLFAPEQSIVRRIFEKELPSSIHIKSGIVQNWCSCLQTLKTYGEVGALAISQDGEWLVSISQGEGIVQLWDVATGLLLLTLDGHSDNVISLAFSSNRSQLTSVFQQGKIQTWDTATGRTIRIWDWLQYSTSYVATLSCDGSLLATVCQESGTIRILDATTASQQHTLIGHSNKITKMAFSHDKSLLASHSQDSNTRIWNIVKGTQLHQFGGISGQVTNMTFSSDGIYLALAHYIDDIAIWRVRDGTLLKVFEGYIYPVTTMNFSSDGTLLASSSGDATVRICDIEAEASLQILRGHTIDNSTAIFTPDGSQLISGGRDGTVHIWDLCMQAPSEIHTSNARYCLCAAFSKDGTWLALALADGAIDIWDPSSGKLSRSLTGHQQAVRTVAFSHNGLRLASGSLDGIIRIWETKNWTISFVLSWHNYRVTAVVFSPDGSRLASSADGGVIKIWNLGNRTCLQELDIVGGVSHMSFSESGRLLAIGLEYKAVRIWNLEKDELQRKFNGYPRGVTAVTFSPDQLQVAFNTLYRNISVHCTRTGEILREFERNDISDLGSSSNLWRSSVAPFPPPRLPFDVSLSNGWIAVKGKKVLYLPQDYVSRTGAAKKNFIAICTGNGRVLILKFDI